MKMLEIMNFTNKKYPTDIHLKDVDFLSVVVLTGDEVVEIHFKDGTQKVYDSADLSGCPRMHDYFDGIYEVNSRDLDSWSRRKDTYEYLDRFIEMLNS